jgi:hypothetical protein
MEPGAISILANHPGSGDPELIDVVRIAGPQALASSWRCRGVEALGPGAAVLEAADDDRIAIEGTELLRIAEGISQVIEGEFSATVGQHDMPWLRVVVIDGREIVVVSTDVDVLAKLRAAYPHARDSPEDSA